MTLLTYDDMSNLIFVAGISDLLNMTIEFIGKFLIIDL